MSKPVPTPIAAALGVVPTVLDGIKSLPGKAVQLPVLAVSTVLTSLATARREYGQLVDRGEALVSRLRGGSDELAAVPEAAPAAAVDEPKHQPAADATPSATAPSRRTDHDELPLPDYDQMTLGSLRGGLRSLSVPELVQVREYEWAHAHRLPVVTLLDNRIAKLSTDAAAAAEESAAAPTIPKASAVREATTPKKTAPARRAGAPKV